MSFRRGGGRRLPCGPHILAGEQGGMVALARGGDRVHLAYVTVVPPRQVRYAVCR